MRYGSVYLLTNQITGEQYVGQTIKSVARRWYAHCISAKKPRFPIGLSISQHGSSAFKVEEIFSALCKQGLDWAEKTFIEMIQPSLNRTKGGSGSVRKLTAQECAQRSLAAQKRWADPVWKAKTVESLKNAVRPQVPREVLRQRGVAACAKRWAGHVKKVKPFVGAGAFTAQTWQNPEIRAKRVQGIINANARPEVKDRKIAASTGRIMSDKAVQKIARSKWKPVYCPELQVSFLSQKYAAEHLGALQSSVCAAIKTKGKVNKQFTLMMVV